MNLMNLATAPTSAAALPTRQTLAEQFQSTMRVIDGGRTVLAEAKTPADLNDRYFDSIFHGAATRLRENAVQFAAVEPTNAELGLSLLKRAERFDDILGIEWGFGETEAPTSAISDGMRKTMNDAITAANGDAQTAVGLLTTAPASA